MPKVIRNGYEDAMVTWNPKEWAVLSPKETTSMDLKLDVPQTHPDFSTEVSDTATKRSVERLNNGTLSLINAILEEHTLGRPIDTLLFLDKSARNGAYLLKRMWHVLKREGQIPSEVLFPSVRFINIGRYSEMKHGSVIAEKLLKSRLNPNDYVGKNVWVVDEYVGSGGSLRRALKLLFDLYGIKASGISQFSDLPAWFDTSSSGIKGVKDIHEDQFFYINSLFSSSPDLLLKLDTASRTLGKDKFINFLSLLQKRSPQVGDLELQELLSKYDLGFDQNFLDKISDLLQSEKAKYIELIRIWDFLHTAGGYFALALESSEQRNNFVEYRKLLKRIVAKNIL